MRSSPSQDSPEMRPVLARSGGESFSSGQVKLLAAVLLLQLCYAGYNIAAKVALDKGIGQFVFPVYRNVIGFSLLAPFAYFLEKEDRPSLSLSLLFQFFLLASFGITINQVCFLIGLRYVPTTYAAAIQNLGPALTFAMAAALGLEQVHIAKRYGLAKVLGTVTSIGGATVITLYKGLPLLPHPLSTNVLATPLISNSILHWTVGCAYILGNCVTWSAWMVLQVPVVKKYPAKLSFSAFICFFGFLQCLVIACISETDSKKWKVHSVEQLCAILYSGLVVSGIAIALQIWCIDKGGPLFTAVFGPVQVVAVAIVSVLIFNDQVVGSVLIVFGLYLVLWGKKEEKVSNQDMSQGLQMHALQIDPCE
ncbi:auxin-induced protein 5NG4-like isoform X2 [Zingiber officinale]|uniref:auxin-induced protein 5NG4-like isoform X2 n=1 Tax=Zingiber officinale TaxID=94328 RepID=UPI001C4C0B4A|nr:auxin-induced protein 5NG4-like isoform X2 [Zingiber officinale]